MRQLATPAGIDHDYNFLSAIERSVERSDRLLVEEKGIVTVKELREGPPEPRQFSGRGRVRGRGARGGHTDGIDHAGVRSENEIKILKEYQRIGVRVERLPMGMARQKLNGTSWSRKQKCVVMQVEWLRAIEGGEVEMILSKVLMTTPIGIAYKNLLEERRRAAMTPEEKAQEKKKRAAEVAERAAKRPRPSEATENASAAPEANPVTEQATEPTAEPMLREPTQPQQPKETTADAPQESSSKTPSSKPTNAPPPKPADPFAEDAKSFTSDFKFFIRRPHTPSNLPTVLIPLDYTQPLEVLLEGKVIVEFPTIYIFSKDVERLPGGFMLQDEFFKHVKTGNRNLALDGEEEEVESSEEESSDDKPEAKSSKPAIADSDTSSSGSSDEISEDEEDEEEEKAAEKETKEDGEMKDNTEESKAEVPAFEQPAAVDQSAQTSASGIPGLNLL